MKVRKESELTGRSIVISIEKFSKTNRSKTVPLDIHHPPFLYRILAHGGYCYKIAPASYCNGKGGRKPPTTEELTK